VGIAAVDDDEADPAGLEDGPGGCQQSSQWFV
jgi:hypothetical protein